MPIKDLKKPEYYVRKQSEETEKDLEESIKRFGIVDPVLLNSAEARKDIVIGGDFRLRVAEKLGYTDIPAIYIHIEDVEKEKELNLRLNQNVGEFDWNLLAQFDESFLDNVGFSSEDIDKIFPAEEEPEVFDIEKELEKLNIEEVDIKTGDMFDLDGSRLLVGDSTVEANMLRLMGEEKADLVLTDPPYLLNYLKGKKKNPNTKGFGYKRDRTYIGTEVLPDNFTELWMANVSKIQQPNFSIIIYENWKNIRTIWNEMEKYWKVNNMLVWHLPNRVQGYAAKYKFFNKYDIAMVGSSETGPVVNPDPETEQLFQNEYESALYAVSGKPSWEKYGKGNKYCPTDFIECVASDEKSSGQGIVFGTKPLEILIPYIKILTKRGGLVLDPFGGSGSTGIACTKLGRRFCMMEKCPIYAAVILKRWQNLTGHTPKKI